MGAVAAPRRRTAYSYSSAHPPVGRDLAVVSWPRRSVRTSSASRPRRFQQRLQGRVDPSIPPHASSARWDGSGLRETVSATPAAAASATPKTSDDRRGGRKPQAPRTSAHAAAIDASWRRWEPPPTRNGLASAAAVARGSVASAAMDGQRPRARPRRRGSAERARRVGGDGSPRMASTTQKTTSGRRSRGRAATRDARRRRQRRC
jgi:hypothetical protein